MTPPPLPNRLVRALYFVLGILLLLAGIIGIFVPLMPTTIFLILAAWCFSRSSRRLETWLLGHKTLGPTIVNWRRHGVIPRRAKILASTGMMLGFVIFLMAAHPAWWLVLLVAFSLAACAWYVLSRPSQPSPEA
ncbi:hypothetical protein VW35_04455 [Devosia soli]|uniref:Inner membrane protein n=1 Tax=Devosia soli TaxID=361041 RepID=A0A0F5LBV5_9HYPH|nr:YbaN family protein [Devosia soli]KKB79765.1 hypothetical protein VW35_04455 [Devosia soli]